MGKKSGIEWTDSTVNPTMGCDGCPLWSKATKKCYAGKEHARRKSNPGYSHDFNVVTHYPGRMEKAARWSDLQGLKRDALPHLDGRPRHIFVGDLSDNFSNAVSFEYLENEVIRNVMRPLGKRHQWLWLTKRANRMADFSRWLKKLGIEWPTNLWAGTSVINQKMAKQIDFLLEVGNDSTIRFLSVEPQWEDIDLSKWLPQLDWIIQGGEWDPKSVPFDLTWADALREQCKNAGVAYFLKQLGSSVVANGKPIDFKLSDAHGGIMEEWPARLRVRQMPQLGKGQPRVV